MTTPDTPGKIDQIEAVDRLLEQLDVEHDAGSDLSLRNLIESMAACGLVFAEGSQAQTIEAMNAMDQEGT